MKPLSLALLGLLIVSITSCTKPEDDDCELPGYGFLKISNTSLNTIQRVQIDGTNYGTLDPGDTETYPLGVGTHTFQSIGISGGSGCSLASVIIVECATEARGCSN